MITFSNEQTIERAAATVYDAAADVAGHRQWMSVMDARLLSGEATRVGSRAMWRAKVGPRTYDVEFEVAVADPGKRIGWRTVRGGPMTGEFTLDLTPMGEQRTQASWSGRVGMKGLWRIVEPFMANEIRAGEARELARLKALVEKLPSGAAGA